MKNMILILAVFTLIATGCSTQRTASTQSYDDVYAIKSKKEVKEVTVSSDQDLSAPRGAKPADTVAMKTESSAGWYDDYDYSYSNRIKRFSSTDTTKGYFDEEYTENEVQEDAGGSPDVSLSLGFGWGYPYYGGYYGWGYPYYGYYGWGYPYYGYNPWGWYDPWYYCCYPCGYYGYGYWNDYYGYPYYTEGYGYYGRRDMITSNPGFEPRPVNERQTIPNPGGGTVLNDRTTVQPGGSSGRTIVPTGGSNDRTSITGQSERKQIDPNPAGTGTNTRVAPGDATATRGTGTTSTPNPTFRERPGTSATGKEAYRYQRTGPNGQPSATRSNGNSSQPAPRYSKPGQTVEPARRTSTQTYSSPTYRQPKSSQEYISPRSQGGASVQNRTSTGTRVAPSPGTSSAGKYTSPSTRSTSPGYQNRTSGGSSKINSTPSRSTPSQNYSTPSRSSGNSYSSPSRSSGSGYSSPSRSSGSGNSGGSGSGGGFGGGGRHK